MDQKTTFVGAYFGLSISSLIFAILFLIYLAQPKTVQFATPNFKLYAALPQNIPEQQVQVALADARAQLIEDFFKRYSSPLYLYAKNFVAASDSYNLDWRLLPAISMQESNGGRKIVKNSYNPFGYGIYGNLVIKFNSWEEAIEKVAKGLKENYLNAGLKTPDQIMTKYTPPSLAKGGAWARGVSSFMKELR